MTGRVLDDLAGGARNRAHLWLAGARPRTIPVSVVPVLVGVAAVRPDAIWWRFPLALLVSVAVQVGTNYANDYSDGIRGTDADRIGPTRLVAQGLASPRAVLLAAMTAFGVAAVAGVVLAAVTSWWLLVVGGGCLLAGWFYTGGARPYGYRGLGEVFAGVFFGPVAVVGTSYAVGERMPAVSWVGGVAVGLLAVALLVANNLRDIPTDSATGKRTLTVIVGDRRSRQLYAAVMLLPFAAVLTLAAFRPWTALALLAAPLAISPVRRVLAGESGPALIAGLLDTARTQVAFGVLLAVGLALPG